MKKRTWLLVLLPFGVLILLIVVLTTSGGKKIVSAALKNFAGLFPGLRGLSNNNPGNLRTSTNEKSPSWWKGQIGVDSKGFCKFDTAINGIRAMAINALRKVQQGYSTLRSFGLEWAPPSDNDGESGYGLDLAKRLDIDPDEEFDPFIGEPFSLAELCKAITKNENGINPYPDSYFKQGMELALAHVGGQDYTA